MFVVALVKSNVVTQGSLDELVVEVHLVEQHWEVPAVEKPLLQLLPQWILVREEDV